MRHMNKVRGAIILLWATLALLSVAFGRTRGFAYSDSDALSGISHTRDLKSSGANDNVAIEIGFEIGGVAVAWCGLRWIFRRRFGAADLAATALLLALQTAFLVGVDAGSIRDTILLDNNIILALWTLAYLCLWPVLAGAVVLWRRQRRVAP